MHRSVRARRPRRITPAILALGLTAGVLYGTALQRPATADAQHAAPAASSTRLSAARASVQARTTGKAVVADALTTETDQTTANPDGSFTLTTSPVPVRVQRNGAWVDLDATLTKNPDGTYSPAATPSHLVLSAGGAGPLATLTNGGRQLSVTLPVTLPAPTVSGPSATYPNVLPDVDLVVTATAEGGYSDVFVVKTAAAAANPSLSTLMHAHFTGTGVTLATDAAGNLTAASATGLPVFTAPAATMWDSATSAPASTNTKAKAVTGATPSPSASPTSTSGGGGSGIDPVTGQRLDSSVSGPGEKAHQASLGASYANGILILKPPASLLTGSGIRYPLFIDPSVSPSVANWTMVNSYFPTTSYFNSGTSGRMQVGYNGWSAPYFVARSFTTLNLSNVPSGAVVSSAQVNFWEDWSPSCSAREVDLWITGAITSSTTWNNQPAWISEIGPQNVAKGYSTTSCSAGGVGWDIANGVKSALSGGGSTLTLGLQAHDETDAYGWKQFNGDLTTETKTNAQVTYDLYPNTPTGLYTSPTTDCSTTTLGDTGVTLYAPVSTRTGANLTTSFELYKTSDGNHTNLLTPGNGVPSYTYSGPSGQPAVMALPESFFKTLAAGAATSFTWQAQTSDGTLTSNWSSACTFGWDPTRPGAPGIAPTSNPASGHTCPLAPTTPTYPVGTLCAFTLTPPNGTSISGYSYQLNQSPPIAVSATGSTTITLTLPRIVNTLTVSALSAGGNVGAATAVTVDATTLTPPAKDGDLTNDGTPDLIVPGAASSNVPPGLWLATGNPDGTTTPTAVNIGTAGLGLNTTPSATDWNSAQTITGSYCGLGAQDVVAYFPGAVTTNNPNGGGGAIVCEDGSTAPLHTLNPVNGTQYTIAANSFQDPGTATNAAVIANGGTENDVDAGQTVDLTYGVITTGTTSGQLDVFAATAGLPNSIAGALDLASQNTPTGGTDWNHWTITTTQLPTGTAMYLWNATTGDLYLWTNIALNSTSFDTATGITYTQTKIASGWNTGATNLLLRAADINGDGTPDLWAVTTAAGAAPAATGYLATNLSTSPTLTSAPTQLSYPAGVWPLTDGAGSTAADTTGVHPATLNAGATWTRDTVRGASLNLDGTSGYATTTASVLDTTKSYTVTAWVNLANTHGYASAVSQSGVNVGAFFLGYDANKAGWCFYGFNGDLPAAQINAWPGVCPGTDAPTLNTWTNLTGVYDATAKTRTLYVNGVQIGSGADTTAYATSGPLTIGQMRYAGAAADLFPGQISDVEAYQTVLPASWIAAHGAPNPTHQWATTPSSGTAAADTAGNLPATLGGAATWATDPVHGTVLDFNGTTGSNAATATAAVNPAADFTVSAWVKPATTSAGAVFSQDGTNDSAFLLYPTTSGWEIGMNTGGTTSWTYNYVTGGTVQPGAWSQLTLTYTASTGVMTLYVNGLQTTTLTDTTPPTTTGPFQIGDYQNTGAHTNFFNGQIADIQTFAAVVPPYTSALAAGTTKTYVSQATNRCLDGNTAGNIYGSTCDTTPANTNPYQHWTRYLDPNGYYRMQSIGTSRCLDGNTAGSIYSNPCDTTNPYQHWYLWWDGTYYQLKSQATGLCLDGNTAGNIYANPCTEPVNTNAYQHWK